MSREIDQKWQNKWQASGLYDVNLHADGPSYYALTMFPYPSGNLHIGHWYAITPADAFARFQRMHGFNVFFPMGFDAFGMPAENAAIKHGFQPAKWTEDNIARMTTQLKTMGCMFSWKHTLKTCDTNYYKWSQWLFLKFYENDLAYRDDVPVDFCPQCQTTIAKEQIVNGQCERCTATVVEKAIPSWKLRITKYKDQLLNFDHSGLSDKVVKMQREWIENLKDWNVSRQRMWGTPIPIIYCAECGTVPVPIYGLPVELPENAEFLPNGESPLKRHPDFKKCFCPKCGHPAERETDTLDTFFCSSWYQYAYLCEDRYEMPFDPELVKKWMPVDIYTGGIEHACMHLLYFRFFTKAMSDCGVLAGEVSHFGEPAVKVFNQGMILGADHQKMSKSRGNVMDPDELIEDYGADVVRASLMFIGPWDQGGPWNVHMAGIDRFLNDVEDIYTRPMLNSDRLDPNCAVTRALARTCQKVHDDYKALKFNTVISWLMQFRNVMLENYQTTPGLSWQNAKECLVLMLAPICPHRTEELWSKDHDGSIHQYPFPARIALDAPRTLTIVIQVNGKKRLTVEQMGDDDLDDVLEYPEVKALTDTLEITKTIQVPNKIINFVVKRTIDD
jgi:leucyl-tRNA synthetase